MYNALLTIIVIGMLGIVFCSLGNQLDRIENTLKDLINKDDIKQ